MPAYTETEINEMSDSGLAAAWELTVKGRQYDGVEKDRREIGNEMAKRLKD